MKVIIFHENIKNKSYVRDYDVMFEVEELDELLSKYSQVERFLSTATQVITEKDTGVKTVFRVLQKSL